MGKMNRNIALALGILLIFATIDSSDIEDSIKEDCTETYLEILLQKIGLIGQKCSNKVLLYQAAWEFLSKNQLLLLIAVGVSAAYKAKVFLSKTAAAAKATEAASESNADADMYMSVHGDQPEEEYEELSGNNSGTQTITVAGKYSHGDFGGTLSQKGSKMIKRVTFADHGAMYPIKGIGFERDQPKDIVPSYELVPERGARATTGTSPIPFYGDTNY